MSISIEQPMRRTRGVKTILGIALALAGGPAQALSINPEFIELLQEDYRKNCQPPPDVVAAIALSFVHDFEGRELHTLFYTDPAAAQRLGYSEHDIVTDMSHRKALEQAVTLDQIILRACLWIRDQIGEPEPHPESQPTTNPGSNLGRR